jgi:hypothetical protein
LAWQQLHWEDFRFPPITEGLEDQIHQGPFSWNDYVLLRKHIFAAPLRNFNEEPTHHNRQFLWVN